MSSNIVPLMSSETASQMMADTASYRQSRRLDLLFQNMVVAGGLGGTGLLLVAALLYWHKPSVEIMIWAGTSVFVSGFQLGAHFAFRRWKKQYHAGFWRAVHHSASFASGLNLTYLALVIFPIGDTHTHLVVAITIAGLIAGGVTVDAASMRSFILFAYPPGVALMAALSATPSPVALGIAATVGLFLLGMTRSCREISAVINQNLELSEALHKSATEDTLVGLANRPEFMRRLELTSLEAQQSEKATALIFVDLDHFKSLNDSQGHLAGDRALERVGATLRAHIRQSDVAGRLGGDEFVVLLYPATELGAKTVAANLLTAIRTLNIAADDNDRRLGASIGICFCPGGEFDPETIMFTADTACYQAKDAGRNQIKYKTYPASA